MDPGRECNVFCTMVMPCGPRTVGATPFCPGRGYAAVSLGPALPPSGCGAKRAPD